MDLTPIFKELPNIGAMGVIALLISYVARKDYLQNREELLQLYKDVKDDKVILIKLVQDNVSALTTLIETVKNLEIHKPYIGPDRRQK